MTPLYQRHPDEPLFVWHRRIHETAHDWRDVAEFLTLRGLHAEAKMVTSVAHMKREERTVALLGVAEERDKDAGRLIVDLLVRRDGIGVVPCGVVCVFSGSGPCDCLGPAELHRLRQRARALRWAAEALMRPEPGRPVSPTAETLQTAARVCAADAKVETDVEQREHLKRLADQMTERAGGLARSAVTSARQDVHHEEESHAEC